MTDRSATLSRAEEQSGLGLLVLAVGALTLVRLAALHFSATDLQVDEAQYWDWSRHLAFGYYSKPPLIAWTIAAAEAVCGPGEACIRSPAPLLYFATSLVMHAIGRRLYDARVAFWAAIGFAFAPGVAFSANIMSTDVLLLFFWALAILAFVRLRDGGGISSAALLGAAIGLGLLAKYAMAYFIGCALIAALIDRDARAVVLSGRFWLAIGIAALILAPNILWNVESGFITFQHTGENISGDGARFRPDSAIGFLAAQFGIIGPFLFGGMIAAAITAIRKGAPAEDRLLLAFALPVTLVVTLAGFATRTNANWGAAAFVATPLVAAAFFLRRDGMVWLKAGVALGLFAQIVLVAGNAIADRVTLPLLKHGDLYRQVLGWRALADTVREQATAAGARTVIVTGRNEAAGLTYYLRDDPLTVAIWPDDPTPDNHFELTRSVADQPPAEPALLVNGCADPTILGRFFADVRPLGTLAIPSGPTSDRRYVVTQLDRRTAALPTAPLCVPDRD